MSAPVRGKCGKCGARVPVPDEATALRTVRRESYDGASVWVPDAPGEDRGVRMHPACEKKILTPAAG
jgi:hypothetical protein